MNTYGRLARGERCIKARANGTPNEGEVSIIHTDMWEEPDTTEKEQRLDFLPSKTVIPGVTAEQRSIRIGRALDANTMRGLGAFWHASQHRDPTPPGLEPRLFHLGGGNVTSYLLLSLLCSNTQGNGHW